MCRVPTIRHEEKVGGQMQRSRSLPEGNGMDGHDGARLSWQLDDDRKTSGMSLQPSQRTLTDIGVDATLHRINTNRQIL